MSGINVEVTQETQERVKEGELGTGGSRGITRYSGGGVTSLEEILLRELERVNNTKRVKRGS